MIQVSNYNYSYPGEKGEALKEIDLRIPKGQFCAVVGANKSGKSTLCYALTGFIPHFFRGKLTGDIIVAGLDIKKTPLSDLITEIGLVFQDPFNQITGARFSVREEVAFGLENLGVPRAEIIERMDEILALTGLSDLAERPPFSLSGGEQQRLAIASIMIMRPKVLVLDEPTSQLDPVGTRDFFSTLKKLIDQWDMTIVLAEHKLEWVGSFADRVVALSEGRIIADGNPREVLSSSLMGDTGVGYTRYTRSAQLAIGKGFAQQKDQLPITLDQTVEFFQ